MKKIFILASVVIIAMTSCKKDEVIIDNNLNNEIGFSTFTHKATKATTTTVDNIKNANIKVYSYLREKTVNTTSAFFNDELQFNDPNWNALTTRYWPNTALTSGGTHELNFFAYHPTGADGLSFDGSGHQTAVSTLPKITYTVQVPASQKDILVAHDLATYKQKASGAAVLAFKHILSRITFEAKGDTDNLKYTVTKITIGKDTDNSTNKINSKGDYTYGTGWGNLSTVASYEIPVISTENLITGKTAASVVAEGNELMLLPQDLASAGAFIYVTYKVTDGTNEILASNTKKVAVTTEWLVGKSYKYVLILPSGTSPITYTVSVSDWENGNVGGDLTVGN